MTQKLFKEETGGTLGERIMRHVDRYRITTPHAVARLFFADQNSKLAEVVEQAEKLLTELVEYGRLARLPQQESDVEGWSFARSVYLQPGYQIKAGNDLARLWYCCLEGPRRYFAHHQEILPLFEAEGIERPPHHNFFHAFSQEEGGPVLFRIYLCRAQLKHARQQIHAIIASKAKHFRHWIDQGSYGVAIVVQSEQKKREIEARLTRSYGGSPPLAELARFTVSIAPTEAGYETAIKALERRMRDGR